MHNKKLIEACKVVGGKRYKSLYTTIKYLVDSCGFPYVHAEFNGKVGSDITIDDIFADCSSIDDFNIFKGSSARVGNATVEKLVKVREVYMNDIR